MDIRPGLVIKWHEYPHQSDGKIKDRWFVVLGTTSAKLDPLPVLAFICTTTSGAKALYGPGREREKHPHILLSQKLGFDCDCILDLKFVIYENLSNIESNPNIIEKFYLDEKTVKNIYSIIRQSSSLSKKIKMQIYESMARAGMGNVNKP